MTSRPGCELPGGPGEAPAALHVLDGGGSLWALVAVSEPAGWVAFAAEASSCPVLEPEAKLPLGRQGRPRSGLMGSTFPLSAPGLASMRVGTALSVSSREDTSPGLGTAAVASANLKTPLQCGCTGGQGFA